MTSSVSPALTTAQTIFKNLVWDPLILAGQTALFTAVPVLDAPVLGSIDSEIISVVSNYLFSKLVLFVDIETIQFLNATHQSFYDSSSEALKVIALEKGINSSEFIAAQTTAIADMVKFTSFIGQ